jgi:hypothetical protein
MSIPLRRGTRCAGLVLGAVLVVLLLAGWRVPGAQTVAGAGVSVTVNRTGELDVEPLGRLVAVRDLLPGRRAEVLFITTNTTGSAVAVRLRARVDGADLDDQLALRISAWGDRLFAGTLGQLRVATRRGLVLSPGASVPVIVRVWLPARARAYRARSAAVSLELLSEAAH